MKVYPKIVGRLFIFGLSIAALKNTESKSYLSIDEEILAYTELCTMLVILIITLLFFEILIDLVTQDES